MVVDYTGFWYAYRVTDGGGDEQSIPYADPETFERSFLFVCFFDDGTGFIRGLYGEEDKLYFTYSQNNNGNFIDISSDGYSLFDDAEGYVYIDSQDILLMDLTVDDDITFRLEQLIYY